MPDEPKERTPHWVHVREANRRDWKKRILDNANGQIGYKCVPYMDEEDYIAGRSYGTHIWSQMREIPKHVPWTAEDYAEKQIVYLREKGSDGVYKINDVVRPGWIELVPFNSDCGTVKWQEYASVAENLTLPDGTELYKEVEC